MDANGMTIQKMTLIQAAGSDGMRPVPLKDDFSSASGSLKGTSKNHAMDWPDLK
jgi:hypothetical protein